MKKNDLSAIIALIQKLRETNQLNGRLSKRSNKDIRKILELLNDIIERDGILQIQEHRSFSMVVRFLAEIAGIFVPPLFLNESGKNDQGST